MNEQGSVCGGPNDLPGWGRNRSNVGDAPLPHSRDGRLRPGPSEGNIHSFNNLQKACPFPNASVRLIDKTIRTCGAAQRGNFGRRS